MEKGDINHLVKKHRNEGYNKSQIKTALVKAGFDVYKIRETLREHYIDGYKKSKHRLYFVIALDILYVIILMGLVIWLVFNWKYF